MAQMQTPYTTDYIERRPTPRSSVLAGSIWMIGITLVLFFLPLVNGLIGGFVGGYKVGGVSRALVAALMPAVVAAIGLWIIFAVFDMALWGVLAGLAMGAVILLSDLGIFIGAAIGGAWREYRDSRP